MSGKQSGRALPAFSCYFSCSQTYWKDASGIPLDLRVLLWEPLREPPRLAMAPASGGAPPEGTLLGQYEQPAEPADGHVRPPAPAASSMLGSWRGGLEVLAWPSADRSGGSGDDWPTRRGVESREPACGATVFRLAQTVPDCPECWCRWETPRSTAADRDRLTVCAWHARGQGFESPSSTRFSSRSSGSSD